MENRNKKYEIRILLISILCFTAVSLPCTYLTDFFTVSEVRPAAVLNTCFGFVFGPVGALGCAVGNSVVDAITVDVRTAVTGFPQQFMYGLIPYLFLRFSGYSDEQKKYFKFNSAKKALFYFASAVIACLFIASSVATFFGSEGMWWMLFRFIFTNNISMNCIFAIPLMMLLYKLKAGLEGHAEDNSTSINQILIVFVMLLECACILLVSVLAYSLIKDSEDGVNLWYSIYDCAVYMAALFAVAQILFLELIEKRVLNPLNALSRVWRKDRSIAIDMCNRLYADRSEIGDLSRAFLELIDEIQRNVLKASVEKVEKNGVNFHGVNNGVAEISFIGALDELDVVPLEENLAKIKYDCSVIEIDTGRMTFMTGKIIQTLSSYIEARPDICMKMKNVNDGTRLILDITGFNRFITII